MMRKRSNFILFLSLSLLVFIFNSLVTFVQAQSPRPAFPAAEGFGAEAVGGRGGHVITVTTLADSGPGSLRAAIETPGPRVVVFQIGGTITLQSSLRISEPFITIAGQTAPGDGITLKNHPNNAQPTLDIETHDVVMQSLTIRPGASQTSNTTLDALQIGNQHDDNVYNIIIDHSSMSWATDEVVDAWYQAHDITIQWSIISEGLNCSTHSEGCHSMGMLLGKDSRNISIHHNLFAHNDDRNPRIANQGYVDVVNNVIYIPEFVGGWGPSHSTGFAPANYVGNYLKIGTNKSSSTYYISASDPTEIYVQGNITPKRDNDSLNELEGVVRSINQNWVVSNRHPVSPVTTTTAADAYDQVLASAGASLGLNCDGSFYDRRDAIDQRVVNDVINGTGSVIDDPAQVGGWLTLAAGTPCPDADGDGMPDEWEAWYNLNPNDPADGQADDNEDGYTNLESFLNGTSPGTLVTTPEPTATATPGPSKTPSPTPTTTPVITSTILKIEPTQTEIYPGDVVEVQVNVEGADELYGLQMTCTLDQPLLAWEDAEFGDFFTTPLIGAKNLDTQAGSWVGAISQKNPAPSLSGSGMYANFTFTATNSGTATLNCETTASDRNGFPQPIHLISEPLTIRDSATLAERIEGQLLYQGRENYADIEISINGPIIQQGLTNVVGQFRFNLPPTGSYDIQADATLYLPSCTTTTVLPGQLSDLGSITLLGGDVNDDDQIKINDATLMGANFGLTLTSTPPMDARADINADGEVNIQDLSILGGNFGAADCQPWS